MRTFLFEECSKVISAKVDGAPNADRGQIDLPLAAEAVAASAFQRPLMQRRAREAGSRMNENDAWIAVTAALANLKIVGDDDSAFAHRPAVAYANFRTGAS